MAIFGFAFFIANIFVVFIPNKSKIKSEFLNTLSIELKNLHEEIVYERMQIYIQGYIYGIILSFFTTLLVKKLYNISNNTIICLIMSITVVTNYFYYMLHRKKNLMVIHLTQEEQRNAWYKLYRYMQVKYHIGLLLGIISSGFFGASLCGK
tara:strand:- start:7886 stop:8338 length:453 start_codon:yes stop_codon:yes gene_type:complete